MNLGTFLMNQLSRSVSNQGLLRKQVKMFSLRKMSRPPNPNRLALPYHQKVGNCLTSYLQKSFVRYLTSIADKLNSA